MLNISGVKLLGEKKSIFVFTRLDVMMKFLVFNAVKHFLVRKEWLESFNIILLYYRLYRSVPSTHTFPQKWQKNLEKWEEKASAQCDVQ